MALFDSKSALNHAIKYLSDAAIKRNAGGWVPPKVQERQQKEAMRAEEKQARQAEKQQQQNEKQGHQEHHIISAFENACAKQPHMNCKLAVQMATGIPAITDLPKVSNAKTGDILAYGINHYAVKLDGDKVIDVPEWGASPEIKTIADLHQEYDPPTAIHRVPVGAYEANAAPQKSEGGPILSKQFPTQYMPNVGRQVMAKGGKPWDKWTPTNYKSWDDVPIINPQDLVGKKIGSLEADLTRSGGYYTGIDSSQIAQPEVMMGGPGYPLLPESQKNKLGWAVQGKGKGTQKLNKDFDYIAVHAMQPIAHRSNTSLVNSIMGTLNAYIKDKRITPEGVNALDEMLRAPSKDKELKELENFPGLNSPNLNAYIHSIGFKPRSALIDRLWSAKAESVGSPQISKILRDTLDKEFAGVPMGHAMFLLEIPKGSSDALVNLAKEGLPIHPSYDWGIHGRIVGKFAYPVSREILHEPWFNQKKKEQQARVEKGESVDMNAAFRRSLPVTTITQDIADKLPRAPKDIQSAKSAQLALNAFNDQWHDTDTPKNQNGLGLADFSRAIRDSDSSSTLSQYAPDELKKMKKDKKFTGYKLKDGEVYFGLKRGTNYADEYGFEHPDLTPNETALVSVINNEPGAKGIGGAPVVLKAIQHGATALDAYAVPTDKHPKGFLPDFYSHFGFEELGRIPFDPKYVTPQQFNDMKHEWKKTGWDESRHGLPSIVIMKWRGSDEDRQDAVRRFVAQSGEGYRAGNSGSNVRRSTGSAQQGFGSSSNAPQRGRGSGDIAGNRGAVGADNAPRFADRFARTLASATQLNPIEAQHFGVSPEDIAAAKSTLGYRDGGSVYEPHQRAEEQGYSIRGYHVTRGGRAGQISSASRFDPEQSRAPGETATFFWDHPDAANDWVKYTTGAYTFDPKEMEPREVERVERFSPTVMPVRIHPGKHLEVNWPEITGKQHYDNRAMSDLIGRAKEAGYDTIRIKNMIEGDLRSELQHDQSVPVHDQIAVLNPAMVRSEFAEFNPEKQGRNDIGAARGGTISKRHPALSIAGTHIREEEHGEPMFTGRL